MGEETPSFSPKDALQPADKLKNPVSWVGVRKPCFCGWDGRPARPSVGGMGVPPVLFLLVGWASRPSALSQLDVNQLQIQRQ